MNRSNYTSDNIIEPMLSDNEESKDPRRKKEAVEHSLSLIKNSLDHLQIVESETTTDAEAAVSSLKQICESKADESTKYRCSNEMIRELIKDHERIIQQLGSSVTRAYERFRDNRIAMLTRNVIEEHKTIAWRLKRFLVS
jgi:DNA-binding ferritin-like protein